MADAGPAESLFAPHLACSTTPLDEGVTSWQLVEE
jgi:hypothetical protein